MRTCDAGVLLTMAPQPVSVKRRAAAAATRATGRMRGMELNIDRLLVINQIDIRINREHRTASTLLDFYTWERGERMEGMTHMGDLKGHKPALVFAGS